MVAQGFSLFADSVLVGFCEFTIPQLWLTDSRKEHRGIFAIASLYLLRRPVLQDHVKDRCHSTHLGTLARRRLYVASSADCFPASEVRDSCPGAVDACGAVYEDELR